ncbi:MAG TPA: carboxypeptidase-like regulatory domain-containing protein, partial [Archangium sp.]
AWEGGQEQATSLSDDEGNFELVLRFAGPHTLKVEEQRTGNAELDVTVPGPPVTVTLKERGVLEVEVFDFDGTAVMANVSLRNETTSQTRWADQEEAGPVRIAGLTPGTWKVERTQPGRLPVSKQVEVVEGQVAKLRITLDRGATVSGKVLDHEGKPLAAMIVLVGRPEIVNANEDGTFEWSGAEPGERELFAVMPGLGESPHVKVTAPSRDVVLKMSKPLQVSGRIVDERGQPMTEFDVNGLVVKSNDGRFRVASPEKTLDVYVEGFAPVYLTEVEADVGDVVVKKFPVIDGEVVDPDGQPVAGAQVSTRMDAMPVTTDAAGRFKLVVTQEDLEEGVEFVAVRGMLSGTTRGKPGAFARIVMKRGSVVRGRVVDAKGRGVSTVVTAMSAVAQTPMETESDASGRFQLELAPGVWRFSTRFNRVQRSIEIGSESIEITLGEESGSCGLVVQSSRSIDSVWLFSASTGAVEDPWDAVQFTAGSIEVQVIVPGNSVSARGLPCGRFSLVASLGGEMTSQEINLRGPGEQVSIEPPPASPIIKEPLDVSIEVP